MTHNQIMAGPLVKEWLTEKRRESTRRGYRRRLRAFLKYHNLSPEQYLELSSKEQRNLALKFQNEQPDKNPNTLCSILTAVGSFLEFYDKPINWKRARVKPRPDVSSHIFSNGDLSKMFEIGNTKEKCMLALSTSLGWEIQGIIQLKRKTLRELIDRAKDTGDQFIYFKNIRTKTGAKRLGVLNPLAIEWTDKWLKEAEKITLMKRDPDRDAGISKISEVFDMTAKGLTVMLKRLARRAQIKTVGNVRFHNLRKWCMSGLSRSGFNEFEVKYVLGKAIPMSDMVYLTNLELSIKEKYPSAYENYLNLSNAITKNVKKKIEDENQRLKDKFTEMEKENTETKKEMRELSLKVKALIEKLEKLTEK